ncbi:MAG: hypothetical protein ACK2U9_00905 [Anaerolineae bacterium]
MACFDSHGTGCYNPHRYDSATRSSFMNACHPKFSSVSLRRLWAWSLLAILALTAAGCGPEALPTPDRSALATLPTATPTEPTPSSLVQLPPRPTDTPSPTLTPTPTPVGTSTPTPTRTPTPSPTPTATPGPLVAALGLRDPLVDKLEAAGYTMAGREAVPDGDGQVVAFLLEPAVDPGGDAMGNSVPRMLVYRNVAGAPPALIFEDEGNDVALAFAGAGYSRDVSPGWRDINGDGRLELPIWAFNGGDCWACSRIYVLQLLPTGTEAYGGERIREITGALPALNLLTEPLIPKWMSDLDGDGQLELEVLDGTFEFGFGPSRSQSPGLYRVFAWDGERYGDASTRFASYFDYQIDTARADLESTFGTPLDAQAVIGKAVLILLAYDARGQRDAGWPLFQQLSDPSNWQGEAAEGATDLLLAVRDHLRGQYERGEPFTPWLPQIPEPGAPSEQETPALTPSPAAEPAPTAAPSG